MSKFEVGDRVEFYAVKKGTPVLKTGVLIGKLGARWNVRLQSGKYCFVHETIVAHIGEAG